MNLSMRIRILVVVALTIVATVLGVWNLADRSRWDDPSDGFAWAQTPAGWQAVERVEEFAAAYDIRPGDILVAIGDRVIRSERDYFETLYALGAGTRAEYRVLRSPDQALVSVPIRIGQKAVFSATDFFGAFTAFANLLIGLFIGVRHWRSRGAHHFYAVCILSYILYLFTYTNEVSRLDLIIYWSSAVALFLLPPVFLHFCLIFPEKKQWAQGRAALIPLLYAPFAPVLVVQILWSKGMLAWAGLPLTRQSIEWIDRFQLAYFSLYFLLAAWLLAHSFRGEPDRFRRQQLKWISVGTLSGILPFFAFYGVPFLLGAETGVYQEASWLFLTLIPLSFAYAVIRYKLMDVDIIFKRGLAYALSGGITLALYFLLVLTGGRLFSRLLPDGGSVAIGAAALAIAFLFAPLRRRIQSGIDRFFYRETYDHRDSLMEFSRALTTEISLERLASQIVQRIRNTFDVEGVALLMEVSEERYQYQVVQSDGLATLQAGNVFRLVPPAATVTLEGEEDTPGEPLGGLEGLQQAGARLVQPFSSRGRTVGLLVLGPHKRDGFFTSEDLKLLKVLSDYAAIALENAGLYHSLEIEAYQLEQLRIFNENIIETINIGVVSIDLDGRITACNSAFEKLYRTRRGEVLSHRMEEVFSADVLRAIHTCTGTHDWVVTRAASLYKHYLDTRDGGRAFVNISLIPLYDSRSLLTGSLLVLDDITEKLRLENQLLQSEKLSSIGLLAAGVAHEVNTPIAGISSYTQMLLKDTSPDDPRRHILDKIEKQTFRASAIVNNLLNFARMSESNFNNLDVNKLIRESISLLEHQFEGSRIEVCADLQDSLPETYGNSSKLQQVLVNLMLNARDAMPKGGRLSIRTTRNNGNILIDIQDSGEGMAEDVLSHIYDPFYTTKDVGRGTGLGLAVTYGIIQEHSGRIFVESTPGVGTRFQLKLPAARVN